MKKVMASIILASVLTGALVGCSGGQKPAGDKATEEKRTSQL